MKLSAGKEHVDTSKTIPLVSEILNPKNTWSDASAYDAKAKHLVGLFEDNYQQFA